MSNPATGSTDRTVVRLNIEANRAVFIFHNSKHNNQQHGCRHRAEEAWIGQGHEHYSNIGNTHNKGILASFNPQQTHTLNKLPQIRHASHEPERSHNLQNGIVIKDNAAVDTLIYSSVFHIADTVTKDRTGKEIQHTLTIEAGSSFVGADDMLGKYSTAYGVCHGDVQPNNYYFQGDVPVLFDFDCMGRGYFAYDLGVLLANYTFADNEIYQKPIWASVLAGYRSVRAFSEDEEKAIYIFAALHMLRVLSYHAKCREQNQGAFYFMTDAHLNLFFGAYKRLTVLANEKAVLQLL